MHLAASLLYVSYHYLGWSSLLEAFGVIPGTVQSCAALLKKGSLLAIAPGGVYEAQIGDHNYELFWRQRQGFAKVAIEAKVVIAYFEIIVLVDVHVDSILFSIQPIIPIFTRNIREAFRSCNIFQSFWRALHEKTRLPIVPIYGGFPVKLTSYIGRPIPYDAAHTPETLAKLVAENMEQLIETHQPRPGNILRAIKERIVPHKNL